VFMNVPSLLSRSSAALSSLLSSGMSFAKSLDASGDFWLEAAIVPALKLILNFIGDLGSWSF
jgi:hypothetical protein